MTVVVDTNVVVSAAFWPKSEDRRCFMLLARRECRLAVTETVLNEYRALAAQIPRRERPSKDPIPFLDWIERLALSVEPSLLGKRHSRDAQDDALLACALASRAEFMVTKDKDLLVLRKPHQVASHALEECRLGRVRPEPQSQVETRAHFWDVFRTISASGIRAGRGVALPLDPKGSSPRCSRPLTTCQKTLYLVIMVKTRVSSKGQTTIPKAILQIWNTSTVLWDLNPDGSARVSPTPNLMSLLGSAGGGKGRDRDEKRKLREAIGRNAGQEGLER